MLKQLKYHYRIICVNGTIHTNWLFAEDIGDAWKKLADAATRMDTYKGVSVASLHIDRVSAN